MSDVPVVLVDRSLVSLRCKYYPFWDHQKPIPAALGGTGGGGVDLAGVRGLTGRLGSAVDWQMSQNKAGDGINVSHGRRRLCGRECLTLSVMTSQPPGLIGPFAVFLPQPYPGDPMPRRCRVKPKFHYADFPLFPVTSATSPRQTCDVPFRPNTPLSRLAGRESFGEVGVMEFGLNAGSNTDRTAVIVRRWPLVNSARHQSQRTRQWTVPSSLPVSRVLVTSYDSF